MKNRNVQIFVVVMIATLFLFGVYFTNAQIRFRQDLANLRNQNSSLVRAFDKINIQNAWDLVITKNPILSPVKVGIIDSGVDIQHKEFAGELINSNITGIVDLGSTPASAKTDNILNGHGTQVAGIIGASNLSGFGVSLPADSPQMNGVIAGIPSDYVLEIRSNPLTVFNIIRAIRDIYDSGGRMVNMSFSFVKSTALTEEQKQFVDGQIGPFRFFAFTQVLNLLIGSYPDITFIVSAGNENIDAENETPANIERDNVIAVAATNLEDERAIFGALGASNFGSSVSISAPGEKIYAPAPNNQYDSNFGGTSASAPMVTGVAGLIKAIKPNLTPAQIKQILIETGDPIQTGEPNKRIGTGCYSNPNDPTNTGCRLNAYKAVCHSLVLNCAPHVISLRQLTYSPQDNNFVSLSQDGNKVSFIGALGTTNTISVINFDGTNLREVASSSIWAKAPFSGDSSKIAFVSPKDLAGDGNTNANIFTFDLTINAFERITNLTGQYIENLPAVNQDATKFAFASRADLTGQNPNGNIQVFWFDKTNNIVKQISDNQSSVIITTAPSISGNGQRVVFSMGQIGGFYLFDNSTNQTKIIDGTPGSAGTINIDGTRVAFGAGKYIYFMDLDTSNSVPITPPLEGCTIPFISGDGTKISFITNADLTGQNPDKLLQVFIYNAKTQSFFQVTNDVFPKGWATGLNFDGSRVAFSERVQTGYTQIFVGEIGF